MVSRRDYPAMLVLVLGVLVLLPGASAQTRLGRRFPWTPGAVQVPPQAKSQTNVPAPSAAAQLAASNTAATGATLVSRQKITGNIYLYKYLLPTGAGRYHKVGVHRVVQADDDKPRVSHNAIFLLSNIPWRVLS